MTLSPILTAIIKAAVFKPEATLDTRYGTVQVHGDLVNGEVCLNESRHAKDFHMVLTRRYGVVYVKRQLCVRGSQRLMMLNDCLSMTGRTLSSTYRHHCLTSGNIPKKTEWGDIYLNFVTSYMTSVEFD